MTGNGVELVIRIIKETANSIKSGVDIDYRAGKAFGMIDALRLTKLISREEIESLVAEVNDAYDNVE